ncbi:MAG TPA: VWA domain-containing protein [Pyrinomonadaceae bacterium]|jgi:VWFA-related protein|nr:VWA domain-containing protein [Pyrinomonadaceae bacterium]
MKNRLLIFLLFALIPFASALGQSQTPSPTPEKTPGDDVLRVTTNLVQLDVVVTDKEGRQVTDLRPEDFEIVEDKDKQQITSFSYVTLGPTVTISKPAKTELGKTTPVFAAPLKLEQVHRTIALVVDDLGLSFESTISVKEALKKFVNEQMQPNDLVAILRTSRGIGSLQQFTSDKRILLAAVDTISWYPSGRGGLSPNPQIDTQTGQDSTQGLQIVNEMEEARSAAYSVGTIQTLGRILRGLKDLPGRKTLMLYSESFMLFTSQGRNVQLLDALQKLTDQANQSSAVIYTIDASGLNPLDVTASERVAGQSYTFNPEAFGSVAQPRNRTATQRIDAPRSAASQAESDSASAFRKLEGLMQQKEDSQYQAQTVLSLLAERTGGTFTRNTNDLSLGTQRMLENESGYYLIGYRPEDTTIDPTTGRRQFHDIKVKVKRTDLRVRSRAGFYGMNLEAASSAPRRSRDVQLASALTSPFAASGIGLGITPIFGNDQAAGSYLRVLLHIDTQDLMFSPQPDGSRRAVMDVVAVTFGNEGRVVDQFSDTQTINVKEDAYQQMLKDGLVFILNVPSKNPGPLQLRVAVRDEASERMGSASEFVQVPNLSANRLALSGLYVSGSPAPANSPSTGSGENRTSADDPMAGPAVRRLRQGMLLNYSYTIYNAQLDAGHPQLQTQMRLFREGKDAFTGKLLPYNGGQQTDMKRLDAGGRLIVGGNLEPGEYVLQVTVTDLLAKNKRQSTATQWIGFEIDK